MTSLPLVRTEYVNVSTGTVRTGATSHGESLTDVESYLVRHDQISSSALHLWGVAEGLSVAASSPTSVTVKPGVAVDSAGRLISLAVGGFAIIDPNVDPTQVANVPTVPVTADGVVLTTTGLTEDRYLTVTWREVLDPSSTGNAPTLLHAPWLRLQPVADVSDAGEQVVVAHVVLDDQSQVASLTAEHRRLAAIPAGRVELRSTRATAGPPATVDHLPAGELRGTDGGGVALNLVASNGSVQPVLAADTTGNLALQPSGGSVGDGLEGGQPRRTVHVEGNEVHSGGTSGGFSFASRTTGDFVENPMAGERWTWYAAAGTARLWSGSDQFVFGADAAGSRLGAADGSLELGAVGGGSLGTLALRADSVVARRADGTEPVVVDTVNGRIGQGTATPTHPLHITGNTGIRQNLKFLSGAAGWSSLSYNAHHNDANTDWIFPDPNRPAVTLDMDDFSGPIRFNVFTTTTANKRAWQLRFAIDGDTGTVTIPGKLSLISGATSTGTVNVTVDDRNRSAIATATNGGAAVRATDSTSEGTILQAIGGHTALLAWGNLEAAEFVGSVEVLGTISASAKQFVIDHPLDPERRYLNHVAVESSERAVVYSGNVECDADGTATVRLPAWVGALAGDFRYQLTCVGGQSTVYVSEKLRDNAFSIAGGRAGLEVSWQVTGVRQDAWAQAHEFFVEEEKPANERGFYRHPEAFGRDLTGGVQWARHAELHERNPILAQQLIRHHAEHEAARLRTQAERRQSGAD